MARKTQLVAFVHDPEKVDEFDRAIEGLIGTRSDHLRQAMDEYRIRLEASQRKQEHSRVAA